MKELHPIDLMLITGDETLPCPHCIRWRFEVTGWSDCGVEVREYHQPDCEIWSIIGLGPGETS